MHYKKKTQCGFKPAKMHWAFYRFTNAFQMIFDALSYFICYEGCFIKPILVPQFKELTVDKMYSKIKGYIDKFADFFLIMMKAILKKEILLGYILYS